MSGKSKVMRQLSTILFQSREADNLLRKVIIEKNLLNINDLDIPKEQIKKYLAGENEHLDKKTILTIVPVVRDLLPEKFSITASDGELHFSFEDNFYKNENERELDRIYRLKREHPSV